MKTDTTNQLALATYYVCLIFSVDNTTTANNNNNGDINTNNGRCVLAAFRKTGC